jgi:Biopolymer transport proteins
MNALVELMKQGGVVMAPIVALSVVLYSRCFRLLLSLRRSRRAIGEAKDQLADAPEEVRRLRGEVQESFRRQRLALGAMIAAAPLLGLLGTVSGMEKTFESLSEVGRDRSMEGLARGISEVLVATESGLAVAIPALLLVYLAHREVQRHMQVLSVIERRGAGRAA